MNEPLVVQPPELIKLLAHDLRWTMLKALTASDYRVQELVTLVREPINLVSYHLKQLRKEAIVITRRSEADGRDVYYSLNLDKLRELYQAAGGALHPAIVADTSTLPIMGHMNPLRVLFVCTHNSARSQMAEGLLRHKGGSSIEVFSAGSQPTSVHPDAVRTMEAIGIDIAGQQSKSVQEFEGQSFDYVITVCDRAREVCPSFPSSSQPLHWGFPDPARIENAKERRHTFGEIAQKLSSRIEYFLSAIH